MSKQERIPGKLYGEGRDPAYQNLSVHGIDDMRLGKLCRAMGRLASNFREEERLKALPEHLKTIDLAYSEKSDKERDKEIAESRRFSTKMNNLDHAIAQQMSKLVQRSLINPEGFSMISTSALFRNDEPVLYYKHWGTDDLDEPDRDSEEIRAFMSFNGFVDSDEGKYATFQVLDMLFELTSMSEENIPTGIKTFNSVPKEVFEPMLINGWVRPRFGC